jgi:bacillithiol system protein YtxJ
MSMMRWLDGALRGAGHQSLDELGAYELCSIETLDAALAEPGPLLFFKHSTACPVSAAAYRRMAEYLTTRPAGGPPLYWVKVIESRPVSNALAERLGVKHQSPQVLLVKKGAALWHASHSAISPESITQAVASSSD